MEPASLVGSVGIAATDLRPSGRVLMDGEFYDANSLKGFIDKGDEVEVIRYENFQLYVRRKNENSSRVLYQWIVFIPLFLVLTLITALVVMLMAPFW